jgi:hypothetical protein
MGVEHRLLKEDPTKEAFNLDKGCWYLIFPNVQFFMSDVVKSAEVLSDRIRNEVYGGNEYIDKEYSDWLAQHLIEWAGDSVLDMELDCSADFDKWVQYRVTADRFHDKYVQSEKEFNEKKEAWQKRWGRKNGLTGSEDCYSRNQ